VAQRSHAAFPPEFTYAWLRSRTARVTPSRRWRAGACARAR
jgi:hypothetical protein